MPDDLRDIKLKLDRAEKSLPLIEEQINFFLNSNPYHVWQEANQDRGGVDHKIKYIASVPSEISIDSGQVINLTRSALDNLTCCLAIRNCPEANTNKTCFPITVSEKDFLNLNSPANKKIKLLSKADRSKIIGFKPYLGGDDLLYALHVLRRLDYHNRLINTAGFVGSVGVNNGAGGFEIGGNVDTWGAINDERTVIWIDGQFDFNFSLNICFNEVGHTKPEPIPSLLRRFINRVREIVAKFD